MHLCRHDAPSEDATPDADLACEGAFLVYSLRLAEAICYNIKRAGQLERGESLG